LIGRAARLRPDDPLCWHNLAITFHALGRLDEAAEQYERAITLKPDYAEAHNNLGNIYRDRGKFSVALLHLKQAVEINPDRAQAHYNLGIALVGQGSLREAEDEYKQALALQPDFSDAHNNLGSLLLAQGRNEAATAHFRQAITFQPDHVEAHNNLGNALKDLGNFDEALAHYDRALALQPERAEVHYNRTEIKTFREGNPDIAILEALAARQPGTMGWTPIDAFHIHFGLAKAFDDTKDYPRAFAHMRQANALKRSQIHYDEAAMLRLFHRIATVFDRSLFDRFAGAGDPSAAPVFVLGMPRSGSSLVEQILASHPRIYGAGELKSLESAARFVFNSSDPPLIYPECVPGFDAEVLQRLGQLYVSRLPFVPDADRIVDKMPDNFLSVGLIRLIIPNARIIHTMRDPIDTCVSCYSKLFAEGLHYTYDPGELGRYYRHYRDLMDHWRSVLPPGAMLDVSYESVVENLEGEARRLIDYCGLPWDDRCIQFHQTKRSVSTASAVQVRQPLYRSSMQRWRKYEADLGPLLAEFGL